MIFKLEDTETIAPPPFQRLANTLYCSTTVTIVKSELLGLQVIPITSLI